MNTPESYVYRVAAFLAPGATVVGLATLGASDGSAGITNPEWVMAVVATITAAAAKGVTDNLPAPNAARPRRASGDGPGGHGSVSRPRPPGDPSP